MYTMRRVHKRVSSYVLAYSDGLRAGTVCVTATSPRSAVTYLARSLGYIATQTIQGYKYGFVFDITCGNPRNLCGLLVQVTAQNSRKVRLYDVTQ